MELTTSFTVPVPPSQAWSVVSDLEKIVEALPGFSISSVEGDTFRAAVTLALGKKTLTYEGSGEVARRDESEQVIEIQALGESAEDDSAARATLAISVHDPAEDDQEDEDDDDEDGDGDGGGDTKAKDDSEDGSEEDDGSQEADAEPDGDSGEGKPSDATNSQDDEADGQDDGPAPGETSRVELRADITGTGPAIAHALVASVGNQVMASLATGLQTELGVPLDEAQEAARTGAPEGTADVEMAQSAAPSPGPDPDDALSGPPTTAPVREDGALDLAAAAGPTLQDAYLRPALAFGGLVAVLSLINRRINRGRWKPPFAK